MVELTTVWEQLNVAKSFNTTQIWILNIGDLKLLETPLELFMDLAYDSSEFGRNSLVPWLARCAERDFGVSRGKAEVIGEIQAEYSVSRGYD